MKVLFLTNIPSPYRIDFFNELGKHCELTVWFEARNEANREWEIEGLGRHFRYKFLKGRTFGLDKHLNWSVIRELNAEPFDVYIMGCYSSPTEILAIHWLKLRRKPFILNSDGGFPGNDRWLQRKLKTYLISSARAWLSSGSSCTRYLLHYGAAADRIYEYPLSSTILSERDLEPLSPEEKAILKRRDNLKDIVLLGVGQFVPRKGFDVLLKAFAKLQRELPDAEVSLLLIGGGPDKALYERIIREEGIRGVTLKSFMQKEELLSYWKLADVFVLPTRYDVWGLVFNEAAAFGLPIVTTYRAGAASDLVREGENGFVIGVDDTENLAARLKRLVMDRGLRERFSCGSKEISSRYSMERMVERHLRILEAWQGEGGVPAREYLHLDS
ncbi:glycosyltransferase [Cohnella sp. CFH 77786]|uniref:glycosyltransferase family 4 protein n=1 Tax=Cohnella sp. CFH 77786 TaxID=2662265 RepID=UPI001C60961C|nr:glycosyltransferase family 4 protein [Cohnella sp. CFH 77786]MBW5448341.1 glycosyltransferase [Cohnella sp. CFH 77786]